MHAVNREYMIADTLFRLTGPDCRLLITGNPAEHVLSLQVNEVPVRQRLQTMCARPGATGATACKRNNCNLLTRSDMRDHAS